MHGSIAPRKIEPHQYVFKDGYSTIEPHFVEGSNDGLIL